MILITATACIDLLYVIFVIIRLLTCSADPASRRLHVFRICARIYGTDTGILLNIIDSGLTLTYAKKDPRHGHYVQDTEYYNGLLHICDPVVGILQDADV